MYFREIALPRGVGRRIVTRHQQILNLVRLWHDVWIKVVFLPCYSRTKLQLSSARQKHDVWTGPNTLRRNHHLFSTFQVKARLYVYFIAVRKYNFLDYFLFCFVYETLCCNDSKYHSLNWKDVSVTNVDIFEKKQFSLQFFFNLLQV